jgi:AcrR family transcriptional regulator
MEAAQSGVRDGTAKRRAGKATAARLVQAAHDLLESESLDKFSMRSVAERAGVSLANLQYYFPRREDLALAMTLDLDKRYRNAYEEYLADAGDKPLERFRSVLRFQLQDASKKSTRQFFIQFWALLGSLDDFEGDYLGKTYDIDIAHLMENISAMQPGLVEDEVRRRAILIASLVEGLLVVINALPDNDGSRGKLLSSAFDLAEATALGRMVQD